MNEWIVVSMVHRCFLKEGKVVGTPTEAQGFEKKFEAEQEGMKKNFFLFMRRREAIAMVANGWKIK